MPFQNQWENIQLITSNRLAAFKGDYNSQKLISFSQCMGTGKTRVSKDFLEILNLKHKNNTYLYNDDHKYLFENTLLFRFDCNRQLSEINYESLSFRFNEVNDIIKFPFSDKEKSLIEQNYKNASLKTDSKLNALNIFYYLWNNYFCPLDSSLHFGLLIAGKNSFTPYVGRSAYENTFYKTSPTDLLHITLNNLSKEDITNILIEMIFSGQYPNFKQTSRFFSE